MFLSCPGPGLSNWLIASWPEAGGLTLLLEPGLPFAEEVTKVHGVCCEK